MTAGFVIGHCSVTCANCGERYNSYSPSGHTCPPRLEDALRELALRATEWHDSFIGLGPARKDEAALYAAVDMLIRSRKAEASRPIETEVSVRRGKIVLSKRKPAKKRG
jgi:hypothetical protein